MCVIFLAFFAILFRSVQTWSSYTDKASLLLCVCCVLFRPVRKLVACGFSKRIVQIIRFKYWQFEVNQIVEVSSSLLASREVLISTTHELLRIINSTWVMNSSHAQTINRHRRMRKSTKFHRQELDQGSFYLKVFINVSFNLYFSKFENYHYYHYILRNKYWMCLLRACL